MTRIAVEYFKARREQIAVRRILSTRNLEAHLL